MNHPIYFKRNRIYHGNCLHLLPDMPPDSVDVCITSPPYYALRNYGEKPYHWPPCKITLHGVTHTFDGWVGCYGQEPTPLMYVAHTVLIFEQVKRVLKPTGTLWLNLGDTYYSTVPGSKGDGLHRRGILAGVTERRTAANKKTRPKTPSGMKPKDLMGIPWMVAMALREAGWYLRADIIWNKPNPMPESVTDRPTKAHEYLFLQAKKGTYYYDAEAIKTESLEPEDNRGERGNKKRTPTRELSGIRNSGVYPKANKRSVWTVTTEAFAGAHFATFPEKLVEPCIKAGSSEHGTCANCGKPYEREIIKELVPIKGASYNTKPDKRDREADKQDQGSNRAKDGHKPGWAYKSETTGWKATCTCTGAGTVPALVLDPFGGRGTVPVVAKKLGRDYLAIEINDHYKPIYTEYMHQELGMFNQ